jgi:Ca-activated chloride channel family protein
MYSPISFSWPLLLLALVIVPFLVLAYVFVQRRRNAYAIRFTNLDLLESVVPQRPGFRRHLPAALFLIGIAAVLLSLARPNAVVALPRNEAAVMLVIDVSGSMVANDLKPTRMAAAQRAALSFVDALPEDAQIGVVAFSSDANVVAPLTYDHDTVKRAINRLSANGGTAIGDGLNAALDQLKNVASDDSGERPPMRVVLLSDGQSNLGTPPIQAAQRASREGVEVDTVGIGVRGARVLINGRQDVGLDESTLQQVAQAAGGNYYYADDSKNLETIYQNLGSQVRWVWEHTEITPLVSALGVIFLLGASVFSLRWFQRLA